MRKLLSFAAALLQPSLSFACSVCFGGLEADLSRGFFWGIMLLGLLPFALLSGFISFIIYAIKKGRKSSHS